MRHVLLTAAVVAALSLAGCGSDDEQQQRSSGGSTSQTPSDSPESSSAPASPSPSEESQASEGTVIDVTLKNGQVSPSGGRVKVAPGEPITFAITSDAAGELHVHSHPEHSIEFGPGRSEHTITIDQPGVAEAELHDPPLVVVQLQVG